MKLKRVTFNLVGASIVVMAGLAVLPSAAFASPRALWVNSAAPISANDNSCTTPGFNTIQSAIDAAQSGATIHVCGGTYVEQLTITKPVSLSGAGVVTVALPAVPVDSITSCDQAPGTGAYQADQDEISICTAGAVSIRGVTVQADWPSGTCNDSLYGILVAGGAKLTMTDSAIDGAGADPINGCQGGLGLQIGMAWTTPVEIGHAILRNVTIRGYQKNGITVDGAGSTATITGTTVTGAGPTPAIAQNGIQVSNGAKAAIRDSTVSGNECDVAVCGPDGLLDTQSTGLLFYGAADGSSVTNSSIDGNDIGVYAGYQSAATPNASTVSVTHDTFGTIGLGSDRYEALQIDSGWATVAHDTISGGNVGIQLIQYNGQPFGTICVAKNDTVRGMTVAAAQIYSDLAPTGDLPGRLTITNSKISGNPGSITGSVLDNSTNYALTLKNDT